MKKFIVGIVPAVTGLFGVLVAHAQTLSTTTGNTIIDNAVEDGGSMIAHALPTILAVAVPLAVVYIAWKMFKRFTSGR